jgi:DNA-binding MarR family transcriptional regulator
MTDRRMSQLQKRILRWLQADHQRTQGRMASSHQDLARTLQHDKGNLSHSLRTLERHGLLQIQRSVAGYAESLVLTPAGQRTAATLAYSCE